jgi:hypothetical protein
MSKQPYSPQLLRGYLLGVLREEEAERLDERNFTDDAFVEALAAAEKDLVDAYVQNELTRDELEKFRSHYLSSRPRRQRAQFAEALKTIMETESIRFRVNPTQPVGDMPTRQKRFDWSFLFTTLAARSISRWALVAAVVASLVFSVWLGVQNARLRQQVATTQSQLQEIQERQQEIEKAIRDQRSANSQDLIYKSENQPSLNETKKEDDEQQRNIREPVKPGQGTIASFTLTPQLRSAGAMPVVSLPPDALNVLMNLKLEPNDYQSYRVALVDADTNQVLWRSGKLNRPKGVADTIGVNLRAVLLKPKTYLLQLFGTSADGASEFITQYPFKVVQQ